MEFVSIKKKIKELNGSPPPVDKIMRDGDLLALRQDSKGDFYKSNYERGILLYALVSKYKPETILEFGTGRGFGAVCMARALVDNGLPGKIYSVDRRGYFDKEPWPIRKEGVLPGVERLAWADVWPSFYPQEILSRICLVQGLSEEILAAWKNNGMPSVDFSFIDAGHDFDSVKHDFFSALSISKPNFQILFDDYVAKPGFGIQEFIQSELEPVFHMECVMTDKLWNSSELEENIHRDYGMALLSTEKTRKDIREVFHENEYEKFLHSWRKKKKLKKNVKSVIQALLGK